MNKRVWVRVSVYRLLVSISVEEIPKIGTAGTKGIYIFNLINIFSPSWAGSQQFPLAGTYLHLISSKQAIAPINEKVRL